MKSEYVYLFFADTPVQVINCIALACRGIQQTYQERHYLVVWGQFSNVREMIRYAIASGAFEEIYVYDGKKSLSKWQQRTALLRVYLGIEILDKYPYFLSELSMTAMLFSCPSAFTYALFKRAKRNSPDMEVYMYEDGVGTYNGNVFRGLIYPGDVPQCVQKNRALVRVGKRALSLVSRDYVSYEPRRLYVKRPELLIGDFGMEVGTFSLGSLPSDEHLAPENLIGLVSSAELIYLEPPESSDNFDSSRMILNAMIYEGFKVSIRRHPRTLSPLNVAGTIADCSGGLWELLCGYLRQESVTLVGFCSSAMLAPVIEYGFYPRIVVLDGIKGEKRYDVSDDASRVSVGSSLQVLMKLYSGCSDRVFVPHSVVQLFDVLHGVFEATSGLQDYCSIDALPLTDAGSVTPHDR